MEQINETLKGKLHFLANRVVNELSINQKIQGSPIGQHFSPQAQLALVKFLQENERSNKEVHRFVDLFVNSNLLLSVKDVKIDQKKPSINSSLWENISIKNLRRQDLRTEKIFTKSILDSIFVRGGIEEEAKKYTFAEWREYIKLLTIKYRKQWSLIILIILLTLVVLNKKSIKIFFLKLSDLLNYLMELIQKVKNKKTLDVGQNLTDIITETIKEIPLEVSEETNNKNINNVVNYNSISEVMDLIKYAPFDLNKSLRSICDELVDRNNSVEYEDCLGMVTKVFIYRKCANEAVSLCELNLWKYYQNLISKECDILTDLFEKQDCYQEFMKKFILNLYEICFSNERTEGCTNQFINALQKALKRYRNAKK